MDFKWSNGQKVSYELPWCKNEPNPDKKDVVMNAKLVNTTDGISLMTNTFQQNLIEMSSQFLKYEKFFTRIVHYEKLNFH